MKIITIIFILNKAALMLNNEIIINANNGNLHYNTQASLILNELDTLIPFIEVFVFFFLFLTEIESSQMNSLNISIFQITYD